MDLGWRVPGLCRDAGPHLMLPRGEVQGRGKAGAECWEDGGAGAPAGPAFRPPYRVPSGISLHVDSLTDHSCSAESDGEKLPCRAGDALCESGSECKDKFEDLEDEEEVDRRSRDSIRAFGIRCWQ